MKDKNWKSKVAFWLAWIIVVYLILTKGRVDVINIMANIALILTVAMMLRSDELTAIIKAKFGSR